MKMNLDPEWLKRMAALEEEHGPPDGLYACSPEFAALMGWDQPETAAEVETELRRILHPDHVEEWLTRKNAYFGGSSPRELLDEGTLGPLQRLIYYILSGDPS